MVSEPADGDGGSMMETGKIIHRLTINETGIQLDTTTIGPGSVTFLATIVGQPRRGPLRPTRCT